MNLQSIFRRPSSSSVIVVSAISLALVLIWTNQHRAVPQPGTDVAAGPAQSPGMPAPDAAGIPGTAVHAQAAVHAKASPTAVAPAPGAGTGSGRQGSVDVAPPGHTLKLARSLDAYQPDTAFVHVVSPGTSRTASGALVAGAPAADSPATPDGVHTPPLQVAGSDLLDGGVLVRGVGGGAVLVTGAATGAAGGAKGATGGAAGSTGGAAGAVASASGGAAGSTGGGASATGGAKGSTGGAAGAPGATSTAASAPGTPAAPGTAAGDSPAGLAAAGPQGGSSKHTDAPSTPAVISAVPEPGTYLMMGVGFVLLAVRRSRKRQKLL